jgi:hypothetical protein
MEAFILEISDMAKHMEEVPLSSKTALIIKESSKITKQKQQKDLESINQNNCNTQEDSKIILSMASENKQDQSISMKVII